MPGIFPCTFDLAHVAYNVCSQAAICHGCRQQLCAPTYTGGLPHVASPGVWDGMQLWAM